MYHEEPKSRIFWAVMNRVRAPLAFLLALAMFITPLGNLTTAFADDDQKGQINSEYGLSIANIIASPTTVYSGQKFSVTYDIGFQRGAAVRFKEIKIWIPLDITLPDTSKLNDSEQPLELTMSFENAKFEESVLQGITKETVDGKTYCVAILKDLTKNVGINEAVLTSFELHLAFPNGITPNGTEFIPQLFMEGFNYDDPNTPGVVENFYDSIRSSGEPVACKAGEEWRIEKDIVPGLKYSDNCIDGEYVKSGHVSDGCYAYATYKLVFDAEYASGSALYGRLESSSFVITDFLAFENGEERIPLVTPKDYKLVSVKKGELEGTAAELILGTDYTFNNVDPQKSEDEKVLTIKAVNEDVYGPIKTIYWVTVGFPIAEYTIPYGSETVDAILYDVENKATVTGEFIAQDNNSVGYKLQDEITLSDIAPVTIGWKMAAPTPGSLTITKAIYVSNTDVTKLNPSTTGWNWWDYYDPSFSLYMRNTNGSFSYVTSSKLGHSTPATLEFKNLQYGSTYVVYEEPTLPGFKAEFYDAESGKWLPLNSESMITVTIPDSDDYVSIRDFVYAVQNTPLENGPALLRLHKYFRNSDGKDLLIGSNSLPSWVPKSVFFDVYRMPKSQESYLGNVSVTSSGYLFPKLDLGVSYVLYETTEVDYYSLENGSMIIQAGKDEVVTARAYNVASLGKIEIEKMFIGPDGNPVTGTAVNADFPNVVYHVYKGAIGSLDETYDYGPITLTGNTGSFKSGSRVLEAGEYALIEKELSHGMKYSIDPTPKPFTITAGETNKVYTKADGEPLKNYSNSGRVLLLKTDAATCGPVTVGSIASFAGGVQYKVYSDENCTIEISPALAITATNVSVNGTIYAAYYVDIPTNVAETVYIAEIKPPSGYALNAARGQQIQKITVVPATGWSVDYGGESGVVPTTIKNALVFSNPKLRGITVTKKAVTNGSNGVNLSNATFKVYYCDVSTSPAVYKPITAASTSNPFTFSFDTQEYVNKELYVIETTVPNGYQNPDYYDKSKNDGIDWAKVPASLIFNVNANGDILSSRGDKDTSVTVYNLPKFDLVIDKKANNGSRVASIPASVKGIWFEVYGDYEFKTDKIGEYQYQGSNGTRLTLPEAGTYWIRETATNKAYVLSQTVIRLDVSFEDNVTRVTYATYDSSVTSYPENGIYAGEITPTSTGRNISFPFVNPEKVSVNLEKYVGTSDAERYIPLPMGKTAEFSVYYEEDGNLVGPLSGSATETVFTLDDGSQPSGSTTFKVYGSQDAKIAISGLNPNLTYVVWEKSAPEGYKIGSEMNSKIGYFDSEDQFRLGAAGSTTRVFNDWGLGRIKIFKYGFDINDDDRAKSTYFESEYSIRDDVFLNGQFGIYKDESGSPGERVGDFLWSGTEESHSALSDWLEMGDYWVVEEAPPYGLESPAYSKNDAQLEKMDIVAVDGEDKSAYKLTLSSVSETIDFFNPTPTPGPGSGLPPVYVRILLKKIFNDQNETSPIKRLLDGAVFEIVYYDATTGHREPVRLNGQPLTLISGTYASGAALSAAINLVNYLPNPSLLGVGDTASVIFYLKETAAPPNEGFIISPVEYAVTFNVTVAKDGSERNIWSLDGASYQKINNVPTDRTYYDIPIENTKEKGKLTVNKYGGVNLEDSNKVPLADVTFRVYASYSNGQVSNPVVEPVDGVSKTVERTTKLAADGKASFTLDLPTGTYWLVEVEAAPGYRYSAIPVEVTITANQTVTKDVLNQPYGKISFQKVAGLIDGNYTENIRDKVYVAFTVRSLTQNDYDAPTVSVNTGNSYQTIRVQNVANRNISFEGNSYQYSSVLQVSYGLPDGYYMVHESVFRDESAKPAYTKADPIELIRFHVRDGGLVGVNPITASISDVITITNPKLGALLVDKKFLNYKGDADKSAYISATFYVYDDEALETRSFDSSGRLAEISVRGNSATDYVYLNPGRYYVVEQGVTGDVYRLDGVVWDVEIVSNVSGFTYIALGDDGKSPIAPIVGTATATRDLTKLENKSNSGDFRIYKKDMQGEGLPRAKFAIYPSIAETDDTKEIEIDGVKYYFDPEAIVNYVYTNANGVVYRDVALTIEYKGLEAGNYIVEEVTPPEGYILSANPYQPLVITASMAATEDANSAAFANQKLAALELIKYDRAFDSLPFGRDYPGSVLSGAWFTVYYADDVGFSDYSIWGSFETDPNGSILLENLDIGFYKVVETKAPVGFIPANTNLETTKVAFSVYADLDGEELDLCVGYYSDDADYADLFYPVEKSVSSEVGLRVYIPNASNSYKLEIEKIDGYDYDAESKKTYLDNAVFAVYEAVAGNEDFTGAEKFVGYAVQAKDENGLVPKSNYILSRLNKNEAGYWVRELSAPNGYILDPRREPLTKYVDWVEPQAGQDETLKMQVLFKNYRPEYPVSDGVISKSVLVYDFDEGENVWDVVYDLEGEDPFEVSLYANDLLATYKLDNLYRNSDGSSVKNVVPLDYFKVSDGNGATVTNSIYYKGVNGIDVDIANNGYQILNVTVGSASYTEAEATGYHAVQLTIFAKGGGTTTRLSVPEVGKENENHIFDVESLDAVRFEVNYGYIVEEKFVDGVGANFEPEAIEFTVRYLKRNDGGDIDEVRKIVNTGKREYGYKEYASDGSYALKEPAQFTNEAMHLLPTVDTILPSIGVSKDFVTEQGNKTPVNGKRIDYTVTLVNYGPISLKQPVLVDLWNTNQYPYLEQGELPYELAPADPGQTGLVDTLLGGGPQKPAWLDVSTNALVWEFAGELLPGEQNAVTVTFSAYVNTVPTDGNRIVNTVYLSSAHTVDYKTPENPLGLSFRYDDDTDKPILSADEIDDILAKRGMDWENRYAKDEVEAVISLAPGLKLYKNVKGTLDDEFVPYGRVAQTTYDGTILYRLTVYNKYEEEQYNNGAIERVRVVDSLPMYGDVFTYGGDDRDTQWKERPILTNFWVESGNGNLDSSEIQVFGRTLSDASLSSANPVYHVALSTTKYGAQGWAQTDWTQPNNHWKPLESSSDLSEIIDIGVDFGGNVFDNSVVAYIYVELAVNEKLLDNNVLATHVEKIAWNNAAIGGIPVNRTGPEGSHLPIGIAECDKVGVELTAPKAAIGDIAWEDRDWNGIQDGSMPLVEGMIVALEIENYEDATLTNLISREQRTTVTGENGKYWFPDLRPNVYSDQNELESIFTRYQLTVSFPSQGNQYSDTLTIHDGSTAEAFQGSDIDAFFFTNPERGGNTQTDSNATIYDVSTGKRLDDLDADRNARSASSGWFELKWDGIASQVNMPKSGMQVYNPLNSDDWQIGDPGWDFGILRRGALGDYVWFDNRADGYGASTNSEPDGLQTKNVPGHQHPDVDEGVYGVKVTLLINGDPIAEQFTDEFGRYWFDNLGPSEDYEVTFDLTQATTIGAPDLSGYRFTPIASNDTRNGDLLGIPTLTLDSNAYNTISSDDRIRSTGKINLGYAEINETIDAGIVRYMNAIGDYVWHDVDGDGFQDDDEQGWEGLLVELYRNGQPTDRTTTTDANGYYIFRDLEPGTYQVRFHAPEGYRWTLINVNGDIANDSDAQFDSGNEYLPALSGNIPVGYTTFDMTWDAGFYRPGSTIPYYPPNTGTSTTTTVTIPGGTPAGTTLDFVVNNTPITVTVPVNIPAGTPYSYTFDPSTVPLANLPNLGDLGKDIEDDITRTFEDKVPLVTIPSTGDATLDALIFWSFLFLASVTIFSTSRKRLLGKN